jgi:adenine-specific DNA-methyltransferase
MTEFEKAFKAVKTLVERFKENEAHYLSSHYQEVEVRKEFIDKFFIALGWDINHDIQTNPFEQEVKVERQVEKKRADYSFSISPNFRDTRFITEAKKPSRNLKNQQDYFQTVYYGWNKTTPIALLTDFEEFHILDCRFKPDINTALSLGIEQFHYSDYSDIDKFKRI